MPYNTRRKSLSLPALGIQLPSASRAHRPSLSKSSTLSEAQQPPAKRVKRLHTSSTPSPVTTSQRPRSSTSSSSKTVTFADRPKSSGRAAYEHTPPPSPGASTDVKIDTEGIDDDIVTGVIEQLEKTGNRPHLIKELAAVLTTTGNTVASSANPAALLSSRLAAYIKRPSWSALSPCPLKKELIPIHPRKVYYYLTTTPRQDYPSDSSDILSVPLLTQLGGGKGGKRIISPSLSNASVDDDNEAAEERKREALSPSPEIDLSTPELDALAPGAEEDFPTPPTPAGSCFSGRSSLARDGSNGSQSEAINLVHNRRAESPPLEGDEREFTQTASSMRMRGMSLDESAIRQSKEVEHPTVGNSDVMQAEETEDEKARRNSEAAAALFGGHHQHEQEVAMSMLSSPLVRTMSGHVAHELGKASGDVAMEENISVMGDIGIGFNWDIQKPETVDLNELDDLFGGF